MDRFDWQARLADVHSSFPGVERKPVIGITGNHADTDCRLKEQLGET